MNGQTIFDNDKMEDGIAIVGMSGRFPGASNIEEFWENLCNGKIALKHYSRDEVNQALAAHDYATIPHLLDQMRSGNWVEAGFHLDNSDKFDADFFGYNPSEAELLDPQQRLFLEAAWSAMEDAGYVPDAYPGTVGIYGGASLSRYFMYNIMSNREIIHSSRDLTAGIGNEPDYVTNRVAYKLNLTGPSVSVQTACSTSLVAIHMASQALLAGECDFCLAGGVMVNAPSSMGYFYQEGSMASPDGQIRTFDANAGGTVFSEGGVGIVCLKRLEDAITDGDQIYSVILGSAVSNDGSVKAGYTAPGVEGQVSVISEALNVANLSPESISYVEAHGTGTPLGDPIEVTALTNTYREYTDARQYCAIGSLKPNVGHLAPAAGVAGVIKAALATKHAVIPPNVNYNEPNPRIDFDASPFYVNTRLQEWQPENGGRVAAVSSFGIGGTNAHLILEQAPELQARTQAKAPSVFQVSAKNDAALRQSLQNLAGHIEKHAEIDLRDIGFTLRHGRKHMERRAVVTADSRDQLIQALLEKSQDSTVQPRLESTEPLVFMFTGQGSQYLSMGENLYRGLDTFRETVDECFGILKRISGIDYYGLLYGKGTHSTAEEQINQTRFAQPILFTFELALVRQLEAFGVQADAMIGHSLGEYVAAHLAGVFDLDNVLRLVTLRGKLMQSMPEGAMLSVPLAADECSRFVNDTVCLAASNGPSASVLSGPVGDIRAVEARLGKDGIPCRTLKTSHAFHSHMMAPIIDEFVEAVALANPQPPTRRFISNVTGRWITEAEAMDPRYWSQHLLGTVNFKLGVETLLADGYNAFIEVGPGNTLSSFAARTLANDKARVFITQTVRHPKESGNDVRYLHGTLGKLWCEGYGVEWDSIEPIHHGRRVSLPTYPFARTRHWVEAKHQFQGTESQLGKRESIDSWFYVPSWKRQSAVSSLPSTSLQGKTIVIFTENAPWAERLETDLKARGAVLTRVVAGSSYVQENDHSFRLSPGQPEHYERLVSSVEADVFLHAWNFTSSSVASLDTCDEQVNYAFYSLLYLFQALGQHSAGKRSVVLSMSTELNDVSLTDELNPVKALMMGVHLCAGHEYPTIGSRNIDFLSGAAEESCNEEIGKRIEAEIVRLLSEEQPLLSIEDKFVAYRDGYRWLASIEAAPVAATESVRMRDNGRYLITGGMGGLGLEFAMHLAKNGAKHIALLGRTAFPPRESWASWVAAHGEDNATSKKIAKLKRIEQNGAQVLPVQVDITNAEQLAGVVAGITQQWGEINGVIHSAGVAGVGMMQLKTAELADQVIKPKVHGTLALEQALGDQQLDFWLMFSSLFAIIGWVGQVDYSAANNFLDAFARRNKKTGKFPVMSINWGGFSEIGMAVDSGLVAQESALAPALPANRALEHPYLFAQEKVSSLGATYVGYLRQQDHWALQEHVIQGQSVMPGTGLLEMVRSAFEHLRPGLAQVCLKNVYFQRMLMVKPEDLSKVYVEFTAIDEKSFGFDCYQVVGEGKECYVSGQISGAKFEEDSGSTVENIGLLRQKLSKERLEFGSDTPLTVQDNEDFLYLGPRWKVIKSIDFGDDALLAQLELASVYHGDLEHFDWHPSLMDMATGPITGHLLSRLDLALEAEYLPYSYGKLEAFGPLPASLLTHIRFTGCEDNLETLHFDIAIMNGQGQHCLTISDFVLKKLPERRPSTDGYSVDFMDDSTSPAEGREVFDRLLPLLEQPQWIVSTQSLPGMIARIKAAAEAAQSITIRTKSKQKREKSDSDIEFVEAGNAVEEKLVQIFEDVLGIAPIGIRDNFFDLGVDSVLGIQVVSMSKMHHLNIKPNQLFQFQTVEELAREIMREEDTTVDTGTDSRQLSLYQQAMLAEELSTAHTNESNWQWLCLKAGNTVDVPALSHALTTIQKKYTFLGSRVVHSDTPHWQHDEQPNVDVSAVSSPATSVEAFIAGQGKASLPLVTEAVFKAFILNINVEDSEPAPDVVGSTIVLAAHGLLGLDANLWSRFVSDLECLLNNTAIEQYDTIDEAIFVSGTASVGDGPVSGEESYYRSQLAAAEGLAKSTQLAETKSCTVSLDLNAYPGYGILCHEMAMSPEEILLYVLASSLQQQSGVGYSTAIRRSAVIEENGGQLHHSYAFPFLPACDAEKTFIEQLKAIKAGLAKVPRSGIGFEQLSALSELVEPAVGFSYLGSFDLAQQSNLSLDKLVVALPASRAGQMLSLQAWIFDHTLHVHLSASGELSHQLNTFAQGYLLQLEGLLEDAVSADTTELIADDFIDAELSNDDFATLLESMEE